MASRTVGTSKSGKAKRPRLDLTLPSLDSVARERERSKACAREVSDHFEALSTIQLQDTSAGRQKKVTESAKICWLLAKYSIETVGKVCRSISSLPIGMTELQQCTAIAEEGGITNAEATFLEDFVKEQCPSLLRVFNDENECPLVLGPPTSVCYDCGSDLVSYHQCQVKYYTTLGVRKAKKVTLRCIECQLLYNYAQFGNKHILGFRYYPEEHRIVEATDAVYFQRELLEFQCSLA